MIDWVKITNEKDFQRLINHLFAIECNSPAFIPSSPYIGFDNGWDGYFLGFYPFENLEGIFSIQSKWTLKSFNEAEAYLRQEIPKEIRKAIENKVQHLRIATNAELRVDQVKSLQDLKPGDLQSLYIWHRENLKIRIERQPFIRNFYFGDPQHLMLTPSDIYFGALEKQLSNIPAGEISSFNKYIIQIKQFLSEQKDLVLLIHAPGGFGKSHLLKELATIAYNCDPSRQVWMIKSGYHNFETAIQTEIDSQRKYTLVLDDADRNLQILKPLLAFALKSGVDIKIVLGSRTSGTHIIHEVIRQLKASQFFREFKIEEWPKEDLLKLLRLTAQKDTVKDEEIIIKDFQNPYFIVLIGSRIKGNDEIDFKKLKLKIIEDITQDTKVALKDIFQEKIDEFLINLACVVPFGIEDKRMLDEIGKQINQTADTVKRAIKLLLDSHILRQVGRSIRFAPDMRGDVYLLYKLEDLDKEYFKNIVLKWIPICSKNVFVNLGATLKYGQDNIITAILEEFVSAWVASAKETNGTDRKEKLQWLENVVSYVPTCCVELINAYFDYPSPKEESFLHPDKSYVVDLDKDDYGPVIVRLIRDASNRENIVRIIERLDELNLKGTYDNYKSHTLIEECVSPLRNEIEDVGETLNILENWLSAPNKIRANLLKAALSEVLGASHEYTTSFLDKIEFGERHLLNHPKVIKMREKAMSIVQKMLFHDDIDFQTAAIDVAEDIGEIRMGHISLREMPLADRFIEERKAIVNEVSKLITPTSNFRLLSDIQDMLLGWWARETPGAENGLPLLRNFPKSSEYEIFRYFSSRLEILEDFSEIEPKAPQTNRWPWLVENFMQERWKMTVEDFDRPVRDLDSKYKTPEVIVKFLADFYLKLSDHQMYPYFITCWVKINPQVFRKIREDAKLWNQLSERFKSAIDYKLAEDDENYLEKIVNETLEYLDKASREQIGTVLALIVTKLPQNRKNWIKTLINKGSIDVVKMVIRELYFINKQDQNIDDVVELLLCAISKIASSKASEIGQDFVDSVAFVTTSLKKELRQHGQIGELIQALYSLIKDRPELKWDDEEIVEFCIADLDGLIKFIDYRLGKSKETRSSSRYEAIPYDGIKHLKKAVKSYGDFEKLLVSVIKWHNTYSNGVEHYEVEKILKPVLMARDQSNKLYIETFITQLIQKNEIDTVLTCARYLPLFEETVNLFLIVSQKGLEANKSTEIQSLLFSKTNPEGGWTSSHNEPPPALLDKKRVYELMRECSSGPLKILLDRCVNGIQKDIQDHLDRDKEFMADR